VALAKAWVFGRSSPNVDDFVQALADAREPGPRLIEYRCDGGATVELTASATYLVMPAKQSASHSRKKLDAFPVRL